MRDTRRSGPGRNRARGAELAALSALILAWPAAAAAAAPVGDFSLISQRGFSYDLYRLSDSPAVVLISYRGGCAPLLRRAPEIAALRERYKSRRVVFWMIDSEKPASRGDLLRETVAAGLDLPVLVDPDGLVGRSLGFAAAGEALVLSTKDWSVAYRGSLDGLSSALSDALAGLPPKPASPADASCPIDYGPAREYAYARDAAPILKEKCLSCHWSPDGPAPMTSYEKIRGWAPMIRETLMTKRMPPWFLDPTVGRFENDLSLDDDQMKTLVGWIDSGAPRGEGPDAAAAFVPPPPKEWPLGPPDMIVAMSEEAAIPSTGTFDYQYFPLTGPLDRDLWIRAAQIRPGNLNVVHHAFVEDFSRPLESAAKNRVVGEMSAIRGADAVNLWSWNPGRVPTRLPDGVAIHVRKGHRLVLEVHYNPTGRPEKDKTEVGLYFDKGPRPPRELKQLRVEKTDFVIPAGARAFRIGPEIKARFEKDAYLVNFRPHMHYRGRGMTVYAFYPDGRREPLLSVKNYSFAWQYIYTYAAPKFVPAGTKLGVLGTYDNSSANPLNPAPDKAVRYGLSTSDEMFFLSVSYFDAP